MADDAPAVIAGETVVAPPDDKPEVDLTRNDNDTAETVEEPKPDEAKAEEPAPETTGEEETEDAPKDEKKNVPGSQRLKRRLALIEADQSSLLNENEQLRQQLASFKPNPEGKPGIDRAPVEADFKDDYFAFQNAQIAWQTRQAVREEIDRARAPERQRAQVEAERERLELYHENANEVRERIPDFDKVVSAASGINLKPDVAAELLASEKSALLQYHLAKNPDKVRELNGITSRVELARAIGRLEGRVHLPQPKKATEATPPPAQVRGGAASVTRPEDADDMDTYVALRKKQGAFQR